MRHDQRASQRDLRAGTRKRQLCRDIAVGIAALAAAALALALAACEQAPPPEQPHPPQRPGELAPPCPLQAQVYRIDRVVVPQTHEELKAEAFDLDGDGRVDAGFDDLMIMAEMQWGFTAEDWRAHIIDDLAGLAPWLLVVETCAGGDHARVRLVRGVDTDANGVLELDDAPDLAAVGTRAADGSIQARDGAGYAPLGALYDALGSATDPGWSRGEALMAVLGPDRDGVREVRLGLATPVFFEKMAPDLAAFLDADLHAHNEDLFEVDKNHDGTITTAEVEASSAFPLLFRPDLDLFDRFENVYWPHHDQVADSLSLWLHASAVAVPLEDGTSAAFMPTHAKRPIE